MQRQKDRKSSLPDPAYMYLDASKANYIDVENLKRNYVDVQLKQPESYIDVELKRS